MMRSIVIVAALLTLSSPAAASQDSLPPVEVGIGYGGLLVNNEGGDYTVGSTRPAFHLGLTLPYTPRFSFEALLTVSTRTSPTALHLTDGLYILEVKQRIRSLSGDRFHAFLTYGATGYYEHLHQSRTTVTHPNGTTSTIADYSFSDTAAPFFAAIGGGFQRAIGAHSAVRVDAQLVTVLWVPVGVRLSAGISIPFAEYDDTRTDVIR
jgi:Outer membrane protein beta-barrel domain